MLDFGNWIVIRTTYGRRYLLPSKKLELNNYPLGPILLLSHFKKTWTWCLWTTHSEPNKDKVHCLLSSWLRLTEFDFSPPFSRLLQFSSPYLEVGDDLSPRFFLLVLSQEVESRDGGVHTPDRAQGPSTVVLLMSSLGRSFSISLPVIKVTPVEGKDRVRDSKTRFDQYSVESFDVWIYLNAISPVVFF